MKSSPSLETDPHRDPHCAPHSLICELSLGHQLEWVFTWAVDRSHPVCPQLAPLLVAFPFSRLQLLLETTLTILQMARPPHPHFPPVPFSSLVCYFLSPALSPHAASFPQGPLASSHTSQSLSFQLAFLQPGIVGNHFRVLWLK